jgi:hypothetical protein
MASSLISGVSDLFGCGLLAVTHYLVGHLLDQTAAVLGIGLKGPNRSGRSAGHQLALTP